MTLKWLDASTPPATYPTGYDGIAFYIGGDTPHVWTVAELHACPYRYRLPIFVRSDPTALGITAAADVANAVAALKVYGAPTGTLVAWDSETSIDPQYIQAAYAALLAAGYTMIDYGSQFYVFGNKNPDGYYWGADWTNVPHLTAGDVMTQYDSFAGWDESLSGNSPVLPFWDTRPVPAPVVSPHTTVTTPPPGKWRPGLPLVAIGVGPDGVTLYQTYTIDGKTWTIPKPLVLV
jgi:hypothetical protein